MARQKKNVEVPGQESATGADLVTDTTDEGVTQEQPRAERNTLLGSINEQGAAIIARFETLRYTDLADQQLTDNLEFLQLVKKATTAEPAAPMGYVTNDEGKRQPVTGKPVLTEHGWHVPG